MGEVNVILTTADRSRKAQVALPGETSVGELVALCKQKWSLPAAEDFAIRDTARNVQLNSKDSLLKAGVAQGTELQIFPLLEAGFK